MEIFGYRVPLWTLLTTSVVVMWYRYATRYFKTFRKMGINGPRPNPLFGTMFPMLTKGIRQHDLNMKEKYGNLVGCFQGRDPVLLVYDPDILKQILVKDFSSFPNRRRVKVDEYPLNRMITVLKDDHWKHVRDHLTPTFSGSKLRRMVPQLNKCCDNLIANLQELIEAGESFECKDYMGSFTMDAIGSTAFNLDIDSRRDKNSKFSEMGAKLIVTKIISPAVLIFLFAPFLAPHMRKLGVSILPRDAVEFFVNIINLAITDRENNPDEQPKDFLQCMVRSQVRDFTKEEAANDKSHDLFVDDTGVWSKSGLTHEEILSQSLIFFLAGFETTSTAISFTLHNLAVHSDVQEKLYEELVSVLGDKASPDYDDLKQMTYLRMCVDETLRMYPPAPRTERITANDTTIQGVHIKKGVVIGIPIFVLHHDPDVWPNPYVFDPERFSPEAKESIHPFQYQPFGMGPRNCVAKRLALVEAELAVVRILLQFRLLPCEKTQNPPKLHKFRTFADDGLWIKAERRT